MAMAVTRIAPNLAMNSAKQRNEENGQLMLVNFEQMSGRMSTDGPRE